MVENTIIANGYQVLRSELAVAIATTQPQMTCKGWSNRIVPVSRLSKRERQSIWTIDHILFNFH